ncbi:MAG: MBL fold metallo-hydrolase [Dehalococcoidia bacterium]|nr:MBL fold metallo-hydrolase [Dehalococcoidia bacterium]
MEIVQFVADALGDASYLVVSGSEAAVVDPQRDVRPYLAAARERGVTITHAVETHVHNDYVSGGPELAALGALIVAPAESGIRFAHRPVHDGDEIVVGGARLRAVHAPGHTHHHTAYLAIDEAGHTAGAFTGGSIIIGGAGRSDLLGPDETETLTRLQWESAHRLEALLPDEGELLPTHGAGSFCSSDSSSTERRARIGDERPRNIVLASPDFETFRILHLANPAPIPGYYRHMAPINRQGPRLYGTPPRPALLTPERFEAERAAGALVVDVRPRFAFAESHVPGSLSLEEDGSMLAYAGWVVPFNHTMVLVTEDMTQADRVATDFLRIGYEEVRGALPFEAWRGAGRPVDHLDVVARAEAARLLADRRVPALDVRFDRDVAALPVPGALHRPLDRAPEWLPDVEAGAPLVFCGGGSRATTAASLLQAQGIHPRVLTDGGAEDLIAAAVTGAHA